MGGRRWRGCEYCPEDDPPGVERFGQLDHRRRGSAMRRADRKPPERLLPLLAIERQQVMGAKRFADGLGDAFADPIQICGA